MIALRLRSLRQRIALVVIAGAGLFSVLAGALAYEIGHARALDIGRTTLHDLAGVVETTAAVGAFTGDPLLLKEVVEGVGRNALVARAEIALPSGRLLARHEGAGETSDGGIRIERPLASPLDSGETVGVLRLHADMARLRATARSEALTLSGLMVGQVAIVALLLGVAASRLVSRPIVDLAGALRAMEPGTERRLGTPPVHARDELGVLIAGANALLDANSRALRRERELRAEIEAMEAQYRQIFDSSSAGIFVLGPDGRLINGNPTVFRIIGHSVNDMKALRGEDFIRHVFARPERVEQMVADAGRRNETVTADLELIAHDQQPRWVHCLISVQGRAHAPREMVEGVLYDITERKRAEHAVQHRAEHDVLTGLKNRAACEATIDRFLADAAAGGAPVSLLFIDLDGFKRINDTMGHDAGDQVLVQVARRLQGAVRRSSDLVGRLGGDEFVVCLYNTGEADAPVAKISAHVVQSLCEPIVLADGRVARIGASVGIACHPRHGSTRKQLEHAADAAMYEVKRHGKNAFAMAV